MVKFKNLIYILIFLSFPLTIIPMSRPTSKNPTEKTSEIDTLQKIWLPPDLSEEEKAEWKNGEPPGWSRGRKVGWKGGNMPPGLAKKQVQEKKEEEDEYPPGWENWKKEQQEKWKEQIEKVKEKIRKNKGQDKKEAEVMIYSAEKAAKVGVPPKHLEEVTEKVLEKKLTAEEYEKFTKAMAYGVRKNVDFEQLGEFVKSNIDKGIRGNELALKIYKEIALHIGNKNK